MATDPLHALTTRLPGRVFAPHTDTYDRATTPRNSTAHQRPIAVVKAQGVDDVVGCIHAAREIGLRIVVQATGHGAAGVIGEDTVLLDTSRLNTIEVDPDRRVVRAGAGATFDAINRVAFEHDLLAPAGTAPDVAVTGYIVNGGVGWLTRPHGLASAALRSVDVVDASGRQLHADDDHHTDVLWAYRGGGGVGIATSLELALFPAHHLFAGYLLWDAGHAPTVMPAWGQALSSLDPAVSSTLGLLHAPDAPTIPSSLRGRPVVHLAAATVGGEAAVRTLQTILDDLPAPALNTLGPCDDARLSTIHLDPSAPVPAHGEGRWLSADAGAHVFEILTAAGTGADSPLAEVELRHLAAATSDIPGAQTTSPGAILLHATGPAPDVDARGRVDAALEMVLAAARPFDTGQSAAAFRGGLESAPDALPPDIVARLTAIRHDLDPAGLILAPHVLRPDIGASS